MGDGNTAGGPAGPAGLAGPSETVEPDPVHWLQRSMAGAAAFLAAIPVTFALVNPVGLLLLFPFIAAAWPLFLRDRAAFRATCKGVGTVLTGLGVLLTCFGMFVVIPSAVILLLAASADPRRRPVRARVHAGIAVAVTGAATAGALYVAVPVVQDLLPAHSYSVDVPDESGGDWMPELRPYGATGMGSHGTGSGTRLVVTYDENLTEAERAALREYLSTIPGAGPVRACGRFGCD
ncbi:hypothetical protein [Streptomyces sp. TBY4]|uniref:hypothetical protein n=1 Tax=Streptomyces sp. TBY4 TaxID=2962030 RepID=UPI0020B84608|nr:hypothetical protein [Streptomyces sp. TBY4]MCP3755221.1 hypothetical protein [Streptomyces sp. TBY4]